MERRRKARAALAGAALCALMFPAPAPAEEKAPEKSGPNAAKAPDAKAKADASEEGVALLALGRSLASYGRQAKSPTALISAAEILGRVATEPLAIKHESKADERPKGAPEPKAKTAHRRDITPSGLLAEAKALAPDDAHVAALAEKVARALPSSEEKPRGAAGGAKVGVDRVEAFSTDVYRVVYRGGEPAEFAVSGDGDTDLDLYIYDEGGHLITSDTRYGDDCYTRWYPSWTGPFFIRVKNLGGVYNNYAYATN